MSAELLNLLVLGWMVAMSDLDNHGMNINTGQTSGDAGARDAKSAATNAAAANSTFDSGASIMANLLTKK